MVTQIKEFKEKGSSTAEKCNKFMNNPSLMVMNINSFYSETRDTVVYVVTYYIEEDELNK